jgi:N-acetylmuramoyl-L-alanine amidase
MGSAFALAVACFLQPTSKIVISTEAARALCERRSGEIRFSTPTFSTATTRFCFCIYSCFIFRETHPATPPIAFTIIQTTTQTLTPPRRHLAALTLALLTSVAASPQQPTPRTIIFIDPAHGGADTGAHLPDNLLEKDITLAFAARLRASLAAAGFSVISTRDADPATPFTTDQRAEIGNHAHPTACIILHATSSGTGIHVVTSALAPPDNLEDPHAATPWNSAQSAFLPQSLALANQIGLALQRAKLPVILSRASLRPVDNLTCPAVAIEIAPLGEPDDQTPVTDVAYQQSIAKAIAAGLTAWRPHTNSAAGAAK